MSSRGSTNSTPRNGLPGPSSSHNATPFHGKGPTRSASGRPSSSGVTFRPPDSDALSLSLSGASLPSTSKPSNRQTASSSNFRPSARQSSAVPSEGRLYRVPPPPATSTESLSSPQQRECGVVSSNSGANLRSSRDNLRPNSSRVSKKPTVSQQQQTFPSSSFPSHRNSPSSQSRNLLKKSGIENGEDDAFGRRPASDSIVADSLDVLDSVSSFEANERSLLDEEEEEPAYREGNLPNSRTTINGQGSLDGVGPREKNLRINRSSFSGRGSLEVVGSRSSPGQAPPNPSLPLIEPEVTTADLAEAEAFVRRLNSAASKIQIWFRRHSRRRKAGEAALRRLLDNKREEMMRKRREEEEDKNSFQSRSTKQEEEEAARKRREERAKEARQKAIEALAKKREAKNEETKRIAEEEVKRVQENREKNERNKKRKNSVLARLAKGTTGDGGGEGDDDVARNDANAFLMGKLETAAAAAAASDFDAGQNDDDDENTLNRNDEDVAADREDTASPLGTWVSGSERYHEVGGGAQSGRAVNGRYDNGDDNGSMSVCDGNVDNGSVSVLSANTRTLEAGPSTVAGNAALDDLLNSLKTLEADDALDLEEAAEREKRKRKGPKWLEEIDAIEAAGSQGTPSLASGRGSAAAAAAAAANGLSNGESAYLDANNLQRLSHEGDNIPRSPSSRLTNGGLSNNSLGNNGLGNNRLGNNSNNNRSNNQNSSFRGSTGSVSSLLSDAKLQNILDFLTEVEKASTKDKAMVEKQRAEMKAKPLPAAPIVDSSRLLIRTPSPAPQPTAAPLRSSHRAAGGDGADTDLAALELDRHRRAASEAASEVTATVAHLRMELETKGITIEKLQRSLAQQRELTVRHAKETEREMTHRLHTQKSEYETAIQRHLSFIDQLIDDKKALGEKCEKLVGEIKKIEARYQANTEAMAERHRVEMAKAKDLFAAAEKLRREKWVEEKTRKIKEITVRGLEPEIQKLIARHKAEVKKVKSLHEAELLAADERAASKYVAATEDLRDQLTHEKDRSVGRERELAQKKFDLQLEEEMKALETQRRRLYGEVQEEKNRLAEQSARQRAELDRIQIKLEDTHQKTASAIADDYEKAKQEEEERHGRELKDLKERLDVEKTAWMENIMKKQESVLSGRERELKEKVRRDRDEEIEAVISRLEEDMTNSKEETERAAENRIKRIKDKFEAEANELESSEKAALEKYNEMKTRLLEVESNAEGLKSTVRQKSEELNSASENLERLKTERSHVSEIIRQEFADRIVATEEESKRVRMEISEMKARHRHEMERAREDVVRTLRDKDEELEEVHKRVKQAVLRKEETVSSMREQYHAALKRADHLEGLLEQQRKQMLGAVGGGAGGVKSPNQRK